MTCAHIKPRVQTLHRAMRKAGLRPMQIWVPDSRKPDFAAECARQSQLVNLTDADGRGIQALLDRSLYDIEGWAT
jgi:Protein  of unknown function (DUF3018)